MKIVFFGSSEFSLAALEACREFSHQIVLAVTTPPQKKGRGLHATPTPVYEEAEARKIPVIAPNSLQSEEILKNVSRIGPDLFVVSSYGKIIPSAWLKIPKLALNVHPSLLPQYRGAAPINWALINGDTQTAISIAEVTNRLDAGDLFFQKKIPIDAKENAETLSKKLAAASQEALKIVFQEMAGGRLRREPQNESQSSYARKLAKQDGLIDWTQDAVKIANLIRGLIPWPTAYTFWENKLIQILEAYAEPAVDRTTAKRGEVIGSGQDGALRIRTGKGILAVCQVQPSGKKEMRMADFARGHRLRAGCVLGNV